MCRKPISQLFPYFLSWTYVHVEIKSRPVNMLTYYGISRSRIKILILAWLRRFNVIGLISRDIIFLSGYSIWAPCSRPIQIYRAYFEKKNHLDEHWRNVSKVIEMRWAFVEYCGYCNIREVLIFANYARTNSRIQEFQKNYYYNSATKFK